MAPSPRRSPRSERCLIAQPAGPDAAPKPLFRDPVHDGAADPVVIWNRATRRWFMFYTARRANLPTGAGRGVEWVHGTRIGIAESTDGGTTWTYRGLADVDVGEPDPTLWAPEVIAHAGAYHMFVTVVPGIFADWEHPRRIEHLTSRDLLRWERRETLPLATDRAIDACVHPRPGGGFRLWYNDERDGKSIRFADSPDLFTWRDAGRAEGANERPGEGPCVFRWRDRYWLLVDVWKGLAAYRSDDLERWTAQGEDLLAAPGTGEDDATNGGHASVRVTGGRAFLFYFTHPGRTGTIALAGDGYPQRRSSIQLAELALRDDRLTCDRNAPVVVQLGED